MTDTAAVARSDLGSLLHPVHAETFIREYWEQRPLIVAGAGRGRYDDLFSLADVDRILAEGSIHPSTIGLIRAGTPIPIGSLPTYGRRGNAAIVEAIYEEFGAGATIVLNGLHEKHRPLRDLCRNLSQEFSAAFQVNAYLTPPSSQGLLTHYDTHDVIVLQIEGSKHWRLFGSPIRLPLKNQPFKRESVEPGPLHDEADLNPGDLIYVPRGFLHDASSRGSTSLHLTVGILPVTWASVVRAAVEACIERDSSFRASLPPAFAQDDVQRERLEAEFHRLLTLLRTHVDVHAVLEDAAQTARLATNAAPDGRLLDLEAEIGTDTRLRRRADVVWSLDDDDDHLDLSFGGKIVRIPAYAEPDVRFLVHADEFTVRGLPGSLDEAGALALTRRLLREGFLTICR